jgi:DNA-3-methyladenine glycosylase I
MHESRGQKSEDTLVRCSWARTPLSIAYHDAEWGVPVHDDRILFEFLTLEGAQAGLSCAKAFVAIQKAFGSFDAYVWGFVGGSTLVNRWRSLQVIPARTVDSDTLSRDLLRRGFKFVGSTICYAFMQAVGLVNDHTTDCFRYPIVARVPS